MGKDEIKRQVDTATKKAEAKKNGGAALNGKAPQKGLLRGSLYRVTNKRVERKIENNRDDGPKRTHWEWFCGPLHIVAMGRNRDRGGWSLLLEWRDRDDKVVEWLMPMHLLADQGNSLISELLDGGLDIKSGRKSKEYLLDYLKSANTEARVLTVDQTGWDGAGFNLPDEQFSANEDDERVVMLTVDGQDHAFNQAGSLDEWKAHVARPALGNSRLVFSIAVAFAAPLLRPMQDQGGGFHIRGDSSMGKSTALVLASSVWGGGGASGFMKSWRTTDNASEGMARSSNDCLLPLDELSQADPKSVGDTVYMLANGLGKLRLTREAQLRKSSSWVVMVLSTGETTISAKMLEAGKKPLAGMDVRLVDIPADAGAGMKMLEDIHDENSAAEFADKLRAAANAYYGTAARNFLTRLVKDLPVVVENIGQLKRSFIKEVVPTGADSQVSRVAERFSLVAAAGELATSFGITGWPAGAAKDAAQRCFDDWLGERGGIGSSELADACRRILAEIETYGDANFQNFRRENRALRTMNRTGWVDYIEDENGNPSGSVFYFHNAGLKRILIGLNFKSIVAQLLAIGVIVGGYETQKAQSEKIQIASPVRKIPVLGTTKRVFEIDMAALNKAGGVDGG